MWKITSQGIAHKLRNEIKASVTSMIKYDTAIVKASFPIYLVTKVLCYMLHYWCLSSAFSMNGSQFCQMNQIKTIQAS
jgi:hypothetical protein